MWLFPMLAAVVSAAFALQLARQWRAKSRPNLVAWATALAMFSLASTAAAGGLLFGWSPALYRLYYLLGAIVNVPVLAVGTIYLLGSTRLGHICSVVVVVASVAAAAAIFLIHLEPGAARALAGEGIPSGRDVVPASLRTLARIYSFAGSAVVVGGAVLSAWRLSRKRQPHLRRLVVANVYIAGGTFVVALGSGFAFYGQGWPFSVGLLIGVSLMFWGFLKTRSPSRASPRGT